MATLVVGRTLLHLKYANACFHALRTLFFDNSLLPDSEDISCFDQQKHHQKELENKEISGKKNVSKSPIRLTEKKERIENKVWIDFEKKV